MNEEQIFNHDEGPVKYYSQRAIGIATYLGGPMAASILVRRNFINSGREQYGKHTLFIGLAATILVFTFIFSLPDHIIDMIPNPLIPAIYTLVVYLVVERLQGNVLKTHKEQKGKFYSGWNAAGTGLLSALAITGVVIAFVYLGPDDFDTKKYDEGIRQFQQNEEKALQLYSLMYYTDHDDMVKFIDNTGIPAWERNLAILYELDSIEGLYPQLLDQNTVLRQYSGLRLESFHLWRRIFMEDTDEYLPRMEALHYQIEEILEVLNE